MHFLSQIQLDACAGEQEDAVARPLSKALATESTYWLPIVPGWISWRVLQKRDYV